MALQKNLVSVVIPAYNQTDYLRNALQSVVEQDYRPIEVIVSDDCSPIMLDSVVSEFSGVQSELFRIRYSRFQQNRGFVENFRFGVGQATGKYLVPLPHDNRFIDRRFFTEAVQIMNSHADCHLCYGNAIYERNAREALNIPKSITFRDGWSLLEGRVFIRVYRKGGMDWSQAMVLDHEMALSLRAFEEPFAVDGAISRRLGIAQDDCFSYVFLLSAMGSVGLCEKLTCEIGTPPQSYSRSNKNWKNTKGKVKFFVFYNIYRADLRGRYAEDVKRMALKQALQYADCIFDARIGRYYHWRPGILLMMGFSLVKRAWSELRYSFKRAVNVIRPNTFRKTNR
jgi:glycosyltransferase involved in cell wall biosynthesis